MCNDNRLNKFLASGTLVAAIALLALFEEPIPPAENVAPESSAPTKVAKPKIAPQKKAPVVVASKTKKSKTQKALSLENAKTKKSIWTSHPPRTVKAKKSVTKKQPIPKPILAMAILDDSLDKGDVVNVDSPLDQLVEDGLTEAPLVAYQANSRFSLASLDSQTQLDRAIPQEPTLVSSVVRLKEDDFGDYRKKAKLLAELTEQARVPKTIEASVAFSSNEGRLLSEKAQSSTEPLALNSEEENSHQQSDEPQAANTLVARAKPSPQRNHESDLVSASVEDDSALQSDRSESGDNESDASTSLQGVEEFVESAAANASASNSVSHFVSGSTAEKNKGALTTQKNSSVTTQSESSGGDFSRVNQVVRQTPTFENEEIAGKLFGVLSLDPSVQQEIDSGRGHVELAMRPVEERNVIDDIGLDYAYPERDFEYNAAQMKGRYHLFARFFVQRQEDPVSEVKYSGEVTADNYRSRVRFHVSDEAYRAGKRFPARGPHVGLRFTVFEASSTHHRSARAVPNAKVEFIGLNHEELRSDEAGDVEKSGLPKNSQYLVKVTAPGYYPTYREIPTFYTDTYHRIYLVKQQTVDTVTRFFTRKPQQEQRSLYLGRMFNTRTRQPEEGEQVFLSGRSGRAVYFGYLGGFPQTDRRESSQSGMFGFFNVTPSFRTLTRSGQFNYLVNTKPATAQYVEFGRAGKASLRARVVDPYSKDPIGGRVSLLGEKERVFGMNNKNEFTIPGIDFQPGLVNVLVEAADYPKTVFSLPWSPRYRSHERKLFLLQQELLDQAYAISPQKPQKGLGTLIGGATPSMLKKSSGCVTVQLLTDEGKPLSRELGPFSITEKVDEDQTFCLDPKNSGFAFFNLPSGRYLVKWLEKDDQNNETLLKSNVVVVPQDHISIVTSS